jgi:seryl-tRNA synthetase
MWELKEKATSVEVKLQYTVIKLEEKMTEMKNKLETLRKENNTLSDLIKSKYATVSNS